MSWRGIVRRQDALGIIYLNILEKKIQSPVIIVVTAINILLKKTEQKMPKK